MKCSKSVASLATILLLTSCGKGLSENYTGTKSDSFGGTSQVTLILNQDGDTVTGTWTATGSTIQNGQTGTTPQQSTTGMFEAGNFSGTMNGKSITNVSWTSTSQGNFGFQNGTCNSALTGTIQVAGDGKMLTGVLMSQGNDPNCQGMSRNVVLNLTSSGE